MIVKMKEILLFTLSSRVEETVQELGGLGVVEIREIRPPAADKLAYPQEQLLRAETAISILEPYTQKKGAAQPRRKFLAVDPTRMTKRVMKAVDFRKRCHSVLAELQQQLNWYETWGRNVNRKDFSYLRGKGIYVRLYLLDRAQLNTIPREEHTLVTFAEQEQKNPVALFARTEAEQLDFREEQLPTLPLQAIEQQIIRKKRQLEQVEYFLADQAAEIALLHDYQGYLQDRLKTRQALESMGEVEGCISYLRGFLPHDKVEKVQEKARQLNWGYQISDPQQLEEVPVYIKNSKWVSIINPVMKFIDIVPGYKEMDVSIYFLIAFALFFAMLVGDAGYGALFMLLAFLLRKKIAKQLLFLIYVLSGATMIWGILSGTYFGSAQIAALPFLEPLIIPQIASFGADNISFMMHLSFLIGAIHLTIAHAVRVLEFSNSIRALSEVGWIALVWGLFFVAENLVLGYDLPSWNTWLFAAGAALVTLFSGEGKSFVGGMLSSLGNLPLSLINGFSDIVSYVRLFAVGMATAAVAASFNNMILPNGFNMSLVELLMAAVALALGHGLNIILALMAVMVHGIRLNMLEFAGHLGVQFSGEAYEPFVLSTSQREEER